MSPVPLISLLSVGWLSAGATVAAIIDPVDAGARMERLTIIGVLTVGLIMLGFGIITLYRAVSAQSSVWREHHETTIQNFNMEREKRAEERKQEYGAMLQVLRDNSAALASSAEASKSAATATRACEVAIGALREAVIATAHK